MLAMRPLAVVATLAAAAALAGCTADESVEVRFETNLGDFTVKTLPEHAPITVDNFLQYVDDGFYDGTTFHRVAPGFVVQGGGFIWDQEADGGNGSYALKDTRAPIVNEATTQQPNSQWTLSMARTNAPDSATSQFFVNLVDNGALDPNAQSAGYAVFAEVVSGFDNVTAMTQVTPGQAFGAGGFWPAEPIIIERAYRVQE